MHGRQPPRDTADIDEQRSSGTVAFGHPCPRGAIRAVTIDIPATPATRGASAADHDAFANAVRRLAQGWQLAGELLGEAMPAPRVEGPFGAWTLRSDRAAVRLRRGLHQRTVHVRSEAGETSVTRAWPAAGERATELVDAALTTWLRDGWKNPGARYTAERCASSHGERGAPPWRVQARPQGANEVPAVSEQAVADGMTGSALFRLAAVAGGVRTAASWENVGPAEGRFLAEMARALDLHVATIDRYEHALTERREGRSGGGDRSTLAVSRDPQALATLGELTAALATRPSKTHEEPIARALGEAYGLPPCCVEAFVRKQRFVLGGSYSHALTDLTLGTPAPLVNSKAPTRLIEHFPCSLGCPASERRAEATLAAALKLLRTLTDAAETISASMRGPGGGGGGPIAAVSTTLRSLAELSATDPMQAARRWTAAIRAPLLYIDPTRYVVALGGQATLRDEARDDGRVERIATVHSGHWVGAERLMGALPSADESALQGPLERDVVAPIATANRAGPIEVRWTLPDPQHALDGQILGAGLDLRFPGVGVRLHAGADDGRDELALRRAVELCAADEA